MTGQDWRGRRCFKCTIRESATVPVLEATAEECTAHSVPVGVFLCSECAFIPSPVMEELAAKLDGPAGEELRRQWKARRRQIAADEVEDLKVDAAEMAAWSNTFGNW